jgi:hypothetical protein
MLYVAFGYVPAYVAFEYVGHKAVMYVAFQLLLCV